MQEQARGGLVARLLLACGCMTIISTLCLLASAPFFATGVVGVAYKVAGEGPIYDWYIGPFANWLGLGCATGFRLSDEDIERLAELGIPAPSVSNAEAGRRWCGVVYGANIDIGIILAIMEGESNFGANMGSTDWLVGVAKNRDSAGEKAAAEWLLNHWKKNNVRARSSEAAAHIYPGYTGYLGHGAGEVGDGFLPSSAKRVCEQALMKSADADLRSCNFWSRKVNGHAIPWYLYREGYSDDQSNSEKVDSLYGWNHNLAYRVRLVARAVEFNLVVGAVNIFTDIKNIILEPGKTMMGDLKLFLIKVLDSLDLLPNRIGWLEAPLRQEDLKTSYYPDGISQGYTLSDNPSGHPAIDFVCKKIGVDVISVANGIVVEPGANTLMGRISNVGRRNKNKDFGINVWIDHGGGLYAVYAHLDRVKVDIGDKVSQGEVIGKCGSTGNSTGPHVHFQVLNVHPNEMASYRQEDPGNINPNLVLGTCLAFKDEEEVVVQ